MPPHHVSYHGHGLGHGHGLYHDSRSGRVHVPSHGHGHGHDHGHETSLGLLSTHISLDPIQNLGSEMSLDHDYDRSQNDATTSGRQENVSGETPAQQIDT